MSDAIVWIILFIGWCWLWALVNSAFDSLVLDMHGRGSNRLRRLPPDAATAREARLMLGRCGRDAVYGSR